MTKNCNFPRKPTVVLDKAHYIRYFVILPFYLKNIYIIKSKPKWCLLLHVLVHICQIQGPRAECGPQALSCGTHHILLWHPIVSLISFQWPCEVMAQHGQAPSTTTPNWLFGNGSRVCCRAETSAGKLCISARPSTTHSKL